MKKSELLNSEISRALAPPPRISVSEWADRYRWICAGEGGGKWDTSRVEVARGPMLAVTEPGVRVLTAMVATQMLKTSLIINTFGYFAHLDPGPMLLVQPKDEAAEAFSKERIGPTIKCTPVLNELVSTGRTRDSEETIKFKSFPGGFLAITSAGSPTNLASRPIRVVLLDEIDKYEATREGDPLVIVDERMARFGHNSLSLRACSPTVEDESRIESSYKDSDQRRASLACPHCGHRQFLDFFKHVNWQKDERGNHLSKTARIYCEKCSESWSEGDRLNALKTTRWHQCRPFECCGSRRVPLDDYQAHWSASRDSETAVDEVWDWWEDKQDGRYAVYRSRCPDCGSRPVSNEHAGFQAGKLYSPWAKDRPADIAAKWLKAKGTPELEQAWWNTQMGLPFRMKGGKEVNLESLIARCEVWDADVPDGVGIITIGVDVQDYRIEIETVGWGRNEESWSIDYEVIDGEFDDPQTQAQLDTYLKKKWSRSDGRKFVSAAACIDSGGHHTQAVYEFCKTRLGRRVWAIKGESARNGQRNPVWPTKRPSSRNKQAFRPVILGVNAAKDTIRHRLTLERPGPGISSPGYSHFNTDRDINYFAQLISERLVVKEVAGNKFRVWELPAGKANEASDCRVYAYGALCGLIHLGLKLNLHTDEVSSTIVEAEDRPLSQEDAANEAQEIATGKPAAKKQKSLIHMLA